MIAYSYPVLRCFLAVLFLWIACAAFYVGGEIWNEDKLIGSWFLAPGFFLVGLAVFMLVAPG